MKKLIVAILLASSMASAQETQVMRCVNGQGQVVYVTNYTCPAGFWPG